MKTNSTCPNCGKPLVEGALEGLCPECMLKVGAGVDSVPEEGLGPNGTVVVTPPESPPMVVPEIGQDFGRYRILRRLGRGGMGVVYEAEEQESGRRVALKVIHQKLNSPADRARFLREGRLAASINHPNCVYVYGTEEIEGTPVIAMEFVTGGTLQGRLTHQGPLPVGQAVDAVLQVIEGLEAAQAVGILHRDIKPSNCFEDDSGTVKIGDFGLSISTTPREETRVTESGALVGTPAFCSPEQLRGEELSARSDIYSVGVTLYYLLTGRMPFEGRTMPQLIANTLEKRASSPQSHRKDLPIGLARVILRCLDKQPSERFRTYADLRRVLEPYSNAAPTPATLGLRFLAGMVDLVLLSLFGLLAVLLAFGDPFSLLDRMVASPARMWLFVLPWFVVAILYYALTEWWWGATPGKALCRLRVLQSDRNFPRLSSALARASIYTLVPVLPYWIFLGITRDPLALTEPSAGTYALSFAYYALLGALFVTARRRNGFAAIHDLVTRTRVVSRALLEQRPVAAGNSLRPADVDSHPKIGPYHVLESLGKSTDAEWVEGYDLRLLRRVLIRKVPRGTPALAATVQRVSRVGRLRWLSGRRDGDEHWDAFEGVGGQSLLTLVTEPQPWGRVRFWLHDLAAELSAAEKDGSLPSVLSLDQVWITREGRAKLLDFPAPGEAHNRGHSATETSPPADTAATASAFLGRVAFIALGGLAANHQSARRVPGLVPLHARRFLEVLPDLPDAHTIAAAVEPMLRRAAEVTRLRRMVIVTGCIAFPLLMSLGGLMGLTLLEKWQQQNPELMELSQVLNIWRVKQMPIVSKAGLPDDQLIGIYVAAHYGAVITNQTVWSSMAGRMFVTPPAREFAERSLVQHASPAAEDLEEAEKRLGPVVRQSGPGHLPPRELFFPFLLWSTLMIYVGIPAVLAALFFRGGMMLLATGVAYVRRDGVRASRLRLLWRSLVAWSPVVVAMMLGVMAMEARSPLPGLVSAGLVIALTAWSLWLPDRGLPDRFAGTWPVPR